MYKLLHMCFLPVIESVLFTVNAGIFLGSTELNINGHDRFMYDILVPIYFSHFVNLLSLLTIVCLNIYNPLNYLWAWKCVFIYVMNKWALNLGLLRMFLYSLTIIWSKNLFFASQCSRISVELNSSWYVYAVFEQVSPIVLKRIPPRISVFCDIWRECLDRLDLLNNFWKADL